ncbi:hypothetical protein LXA43DRAFT_1166554 [Ganoderma leucocontextum]|nr:hypothetical protein LXA43DRAFT_1166554 [Ganoderma leucocontextum]
MVILANRHQSAFGQTLDPVVATERDTPSISQARLASKLEAGSFLPDHMRGEMTPDTRRTLSLSLTLTHWTPLPSQGLSKSSAALDASLTANITGFHSPLVTSSGTFPASNARPTRPTIEHALDETEIRGRSVAESQQSTGRFPRFFAYLLRHGTPGSESDEGRSRPRPRSPSRRSADPGGAQASVATIPDAPTQCGVGDETALQSCAAASVAGTLALPLAERSSSPSRASTPATPAPADTLALRLAPASEHGIHWQEDSFSVSGTPVSVSVTAMANHPPSTSTSRGGVGVGERITAESSQLSFPSGSSSQNQTTSMSAVSNPYADTDADADEQDEQAQDAQNPAGSSGAQTQDGQPRKKKTRRAGVAITRVRRMQREVRRLAEEEEAIPQRPPPGRTLLPLQPLAVQPVYPGSAHQMHMSLGSPTSARYGQYPGGLPLASPATSPPPRPLTTPAASSHARQPRSEATPPGHGLAPAAHPHSLARGPLYDRILEDGDDVVLMPRLPSASPTGSSIWAIRPEERDSTRPRGGSA